MRFLKNIVSGFILKILCREINFKISIEFIQMQKPIGVAFLWDFDQSLDWCSIAWTPSFHVFAILLSCENIFIFFCLLNLDFDFSNKNSV